MNKHSTSIFDRLCGFLFLAQLRRTNEKQTLFFNRNFLSSCDKFCLCFEKQAFGVYKHGMVLFSSFCTDYVFLFLPFIITIPICRDEQFVSRLLLLSLIAFFLLFERFSLQFVFSVLYIQTNRENPS